VGSSEGIDIDSCNTWSKKALVEDFGEVTRLEKGIKKLV